MCISGNVCLWGWGVEGGMRDQGGLCSCQSLAQHMGPGRGHRAGKPLRTREVRTREVQPTGRGTAGRRVAQRRQRYGGLRPLQLSPGYLQSPTMPSPSLVGGTSLMALKAL